MELRREPDLTICCLQEIVRKRKKAQDEMGQQAAKGTRVAGGQDEEEEEVDEGFEFETMGISFLEELPTEMVLHILSFLSLQELMNASCVNRHMYTLAGSSVVWRSLVIRECPNSGIQSSDVEQFGWKALAKTQLKKRCFRCGAAPSFVVLFDNTRKCQTCFDLADAATSALVERALAEISTTDQVKSATLSRLGLCLARMGKHDEATAILEKVLSRDREVYGDLSLQVARDLLALARVCKLLNNTIVYVSREKLDISLRARAYLDEVLDIRAKVLGENETSSEIAECFGMLGGCENVSAYWQPNEAAKQETLMKAKDYVERSVALYEVLKDEEGLAEILTSLSGICRVTGDETRAIECSNRALQLATKVYGPKDTHVADAMQSFGYLYWNLNNTDTHYLRKSLDWHYQELALREELLGAQHPVTKRARQDVVILLGRLGRIEELRMLIDRYPDLEGVN